MAETIIAVIFMIPIYGILIWTYFCPEESILFGKKWMYKEEPEISNAAIRYTKFSSITAMVGLPIMVLSLILEIYVLRLVLVIFPLVIVIGAIIIYTDDKDN